MSQTTFFVRYLETNRDFIRLDTVTVNFVRFMTVAVYDWGYIIETEYVDEDGTTTLEVLGSQDGKTAVIMNRERFGTAHNDMKSYPRDSHYPVGCRVRLFRDAA
jgi:hypothetical protein